ncbi:hypothetical protein PISMIDRAFT_18373 [Pisolithus microcarpus 441]|uniref:Unplaced genomic scaffold scaffold_352, whole genome shotgun sequence n=1 Tax=Pisolithus microcarpus 441 TaxID=765257 RepID=A0A0C9XKT4_9AGAM|nr:hypothetical protein PISMIDRAFT_18373 [Pisolithus microcarpus 441]
MPNCPRCLKSFSTARRVTAHLAQPKSKCRAWQREQLGLSLYSSSSADNSTPGSSPTFSDHELPANDDFDAIQFDPDALEAVIPFDDFDQGREERIWELSAAESAVLLASLGQGCQVQRFPNAGTVFGVGNTFLRRFEMDQYSSFHLTNLYYPFANLDDWEMANFLLQSKLSMAKIDEYLSLKMVHKMLLSFWMAKELQNRAELLPTRPCWNYRIVNTPYPTKSPAILYFCDPLNCIEALFNHLYYVDHMIYTPFRVFTTAERVIREFSEWMSGDVAWQMQSNLPAGATLCSVVLSSDKTHITNMCGGKVAHPLLISLANIKMAVQNKASSHVFLLTALIPVIEFIHPVPRMRSVLEARLFHQCLDIILQPLKIAAQVGRMMSDPVGGLCHCFTLLAAYIINTPEACMLACIHGKTSPVTMASHKHFGDAFQHERRTGAKTLSQLSHIQCDPNDVERYYTLCKQFRLSGVAKPFWRNWPLSDPANFLPLEPLHHWYQKFWDHDVQWCKNALGAQELDFRYSVLHPIVGMCHFNHGIMTLKQVTGWAQRDMQRYMIAAIGGAASQDVVIAVCALMDFRYLAQAPRITSIVQENISAALLEFHNHKDAITSKGLQRGMESGAALDHWLIPKLELMQSVAPSISELGVPVQWSADTMEHAHTEVVKEPASTTNNQNYDVQICHYLDCVERCWLFETAICLCAQNGTNDARDHNVLDSPVEDSSSRDDETTMEDSEEDTMAVLNDIWSPKRPVPNFFTTAEQLQTALPGSVPHPTCAFTSGATALCVNYMPAIKSISIDKVAELFNLPDLRGALADYLDHEGAHAQNFHSFGRQRRSPPDAHLPFRTFKSGTNSLGPVFTINARPPDHTWEYGHHDAAILQVDAHHEWPSSGLVGHAVVDVRLIMCPISPKGIQLVWSDRFLVYVQQFDIVSQQQASMDQTTGLHVLNRATRASGEFLGDIFPLDQIKSYAHLVPRFGETADIRLTSTNSFHSVWSFLLNKYFDKDFYYALSL